ncbi:MAG: hypothetical protein AAF928_20155 [Myxococcota bacterium]
MRYRCSRVVVACLTVVAAAGCAPRYHWVDAEPDGQEPRRGAAGDAAERRDEAAERAALKGPRTSEDLSCEGSTGATREFARRNRYRGVEGFNTRGCVRAGSWTAAE